MSASRLSIARAAHAVEGAGEPFRRLLEQIRRVIITFATREPAAFRLPIADWIQYGASPRATLALPLGAKASAFPAGRAYVTPQDVKDVAPDVLRHRIIVTYEAEAEEKTPEDVVEVVLDHVAVP
jgi:MoxR-like ATPase